MNLNPISTTLIGYSSIFSAFLILGVFLFDLIVYSATDYDQLLAYNLLNEQFVHSHSL